MTIEALDHKEDVKLLDDQLSENDKRRHSWEGDIPVLRGPLSEEEKRIADKEAAERADKEAEATYKKRQLELTESANKLTATNVKITRILIFITAIGAVAALYQGYIANNNARSAEVSAQAAKSAADVASQGLIEAQRFNQKQIELSTQALKDSNTSSLENLKAAQNALNATIENFRQDQRPYIWHDTLQGDDSLPGFSAMRVYYTNYGKSPALRFSSTGHVFCGTEALPDAYRYLDRVKKERSWDNKNTVEPPSVSPGLPTPNRGYDTFVTDPLTPQQKALCAGASPMLPRVTVGAWEYYDLAGRRYYGEFCNGIHLGIKRGYDASGNCDEHNTLK